MPAREPYENNQMVKEEVKALWRLCFDDSEEFIEMYFDLRYNNDANIAIESGNEVIAALQMIPYPMTFCGKVIDTSYISGACTHPEFRSKGVMRELLSQAHTRMMQKGISISTLIPGEPWLFDYYTRMGYASVFDYSKEALTLPKERKTAVVVSDITVRSMTARSIAEQNPEEIYQYLNAKMAARPNCIQHTETDFKTVLADLNQTHGSLYVATTPEEGIVGIAVVYHEEESIQISELLTDNESIEAHLIEHIRQTIGSKSLFLITPPAEGATTYSLGMARIIDAKTVLQLYAATFPEEDLNIELMDKQLSANNGYYYLCNGKCMYNKERLPGAHIQMSISELSQRILAPLRPYMSLMLN